MKKNITYRIEVFGHISLEDQVTQSFDTFELANKKLKNFRSADSTAYVVKTVKTGDKVQEFILY